MSSIANRKFTDMRQIEFQQNGSSRVTAMLTQPLLENSSTYMCEITDLQCTMGHELAFPHGAWMFSIMRRPRGIPQAAMALLNQRELEKFVEQRAKAGKSAPATGMWGWVDLDEMDWMPGSMIDHDLQIVTDIPASQIIEYPVYTRKYYSVMDFAYDLSQQVKVIDRKIAAVIGQETNLPNAPVDWAQWTEETWFNIALTFDSGGHFQFHTTELFRKNYMVITSPLFQEVTGFPTFVANYAANGEPLYSITDLESNVDELHHVEPAVAAGGFAEDEYNDFLDDNDTVLYAIEEPHTTGTQSTEVRDIIPIQDGIDIRKKLIVEVSLPISHTLSWDGNKESTRYVLQEFEFPQSMVELGFEQAVDFRQSKIRWNEEALHGQVEFLSGGSNLAIKKLQEGQMQAFRVDLLLDYKHWDPITSKFERRQKQLNIGSGGFFYLKLLFTKETV